MPTTLPHLRSMTWSGFTSMYAALPSHDSESYTGPGQIGVAFSAHDDVQYRIGNRSRLASYPAGSVVCSGHDGIVWSRVREPTEALEIYPSPWLLAQAGADGTEWPVERPAVGVADPVVLGVASTLRRVHSTGAYLSETASSTLAHLLARHVLRHYADPPAAAARPPGVLSRRALDRTFALMEADLGGDLTLDRLAGVAHLSPFHFARCFAATTGMPPHAFVTSRRMDRARQLLRTTSLPVERIAGEVGIVNLSHFRRVFRVHVGVTPGAYRRSVA